jgi:hypothetical protein
MLRLISHEYVAEKEIKFWLVTSRLARKENLSAASLTVTLWPTSSCVKCFTSGVMHLGGECTLFAIVFSLRSDETSRNCDFVSCVCTHELDPVEKKPIQ